MLNEGIITLKGSGLTDGLTWTFPITGKVTVKLTAYLRVRLWHSNPERACTVVGTRDDLWEIEDQCFTTVSTV